MADDPTLTPTSDATDPPANPPSDPPADQPPVDPAAAAKDDDLGTTALGNNPADPDAPSDPKPEIPETYELTAPEGFDKLDPEAIAIATPVFKELGLSTEQAQKLMPVAGEFAKRIVAERDQQLMGSITEQRKSWLEEAKADKEIGGQNWNASLGLAAKALDQLGFPKGSPFRNILDESGLGNHPEAIRAFARVGKAIGEDTDLVRGSQNAGVKPTDEELFYGSKG